MTEFGIRLRRLREERNLTQEQLAKVSDVHYDTYRKYEMGSVKPRSENLKKLAKFYNMTADELLGIGTAMTFEYDQVDIRILREIMSSDLPPHLKVDALDKTLNRLYDQWEEVFKVRNMTDLELSLYKDKIIRTIRYNENDERLIHRASEMRFEILKNLYMTTVGRNMMYNIETLTEDDVRQLLADGDDSHDNQIRVTITGQVYLSQDIGGADNIDGLKFRFETFDAGNGYVGMKAVSDSVLVGRIYRTLKANWPNPKYGTYIDIWEQ